MTPTTRKPLVIRAALALALAAPATFADEAGPSEKELGWSNDAELALVLTAGNSESRTFGFANSLVHDWENAKFTFGVHLLKASSGVRTVSNVGGTVTETSAVETTSELYDIGGHYARTLTGNFTWYGLAGWFRNRFSGIDDRWRAGGGIGYKFFADDTHSLIMESGFQWLREQQISGLSDDSADYRLYGGYHRALSPNAELDGGLELLQNLSRGDDRRLNAVISATANLTARTALKVGYTLLFDNEPVVVPVPDSSGQGPDGFFVYDKSDSILTASLVLKL